MQPLLIPEKKRKVFQSPSSVLVTSIGPIRPSTSKSAAPINAALASVIFQGRTMIPNNAAIVIAEIKIVLTTADI